MNKYIIFSDVDGTIYGSERTVQPATIKDISFASSKGVEFVVTTGNGTVFSSMKRLAKILDTRYFITSNGASLYDFKEDKYLIEKILKVDLANKIVQKATSLGILAMWWGREESLSYNDLMWDEMKSVLKIACGEEILQQKDNVETDIYKIDFYHPKRDNDKMGELHKFILSLGEDMEVAIMGNGHIEITAKNVSKGETIKEFCKMFDINPEDTMGIGDSSNDYTMFETVGYSYAMDNASEEVKTKTKYFTSDVHQNGLGEAIIDYLHRTKQDR